jgi:hypothetical protein
VGKAWRAPSSVGHRALPVNIRLLKILGKDKRSSLFLSAAGHDENRLISSATEEVHVRAAAGTNRGPEHWREDLVVGHAQVSVLQKLFFFATDAPC